ncbi:MAG: phage terminase large subunit [Patescibacteria group bacterium]|nr:phage terminase large subunit [Patescibacteria group bacterium]
MTGASTTVVWNHRLARGKVCGACGEAKGIKYYASKDNERCLLCEAINAPLTTAKAPEKVIDAVEVVEPDFPVVEIDYTDPSAKEIAARTLARRKLLHFIRRFKPKYLPGWVHEDICRRLERFMEAVERGEEPRLLLMCPPRMGKSEIGSRHFAPFVLGHHPDWEIIAASHTGGLTMSFSRYIRDLLRDPSYQALFPNTKLDPSSQSVENWNLTRGGGYLAAGVGTGITGRGAHILLLDDLVKDIEAADSQTQRDSMWEWYASTAYTRLAPGGGVLGIMTWWHEDDWAGRIQQVMETGDGDKFEIVKYPAINDMGDEYLLTDDSIVQLPPNSSIPEGARMTRPHNTAVHPERYSTDAMLRIMRNLFAAGQQRVWSALYQQNPTPNDGITFTKKMFRSYSHVPQTYGRTIYQAWDFAITTKQVNDWTVGVTVLHDEHDDIFVLDVNRFRSDDGEDIMQTVVNYARDWNCMTVGVEDGQIWKSLETTFNRICSEEKFYPAYEVLQPLTDKMVRAQPLKGRMQAGKVWFPEKATWYQTLKTELLQFPAGKHDDQVDGLAWVVRLILRKNPPKLKAPTPVKSWKDKLKGIMKGQAGNSHMAS